MLHVVLDTSIYSADRKRNKGPFRALERLCKGKKVQLHIPHFVKHEFVSQQFVDIRKALKGIREATEEIKKVTDHKGIVTYASASKEKAINHDEC